jgi:hypothetical protein
LRVSSTSRRRSRTTISCSSRDWRKSSCEMLSWTSSPLSFEASSSRYLRAARTPSSAARSCWS